ncbi:MAG: transaldolase [Candidatus Omnitrophica bacterium]|nr:transaldolase [Candidatus Omnitrophota bacterium]
MWLKTANPLKEILKYGQSVWYDGLVSEEEFAAMIREDGIRGATTNPTIFEKALSGSEYDAEIAAFGARHAEDEIYRTLAVRSVQKVADLFLPVYDRTRGCDGFVSIEVSPLLAYDTAATVEEARLLYRAVDRKNIMIKVPATPAGIPAIETLISEGISVNVTLIFSVKRHEEVMLAYLSGLEKGLAAGRPVSEPASVASFFVSRVDTLADKEIEAKGEAFKGFLGKTAIANSKIAYANFERIFSDERFKKLKARGAKVQRPLWASTGTKNPAYGDVLYVESLIGPDTVNTIPPATLAAFRDHGKAEPLLKTDLADAEKTLRALRGAGVDLDLITRELEDAGVRLFADSYTRILEGIRRKIK